MNENKSKTLFERAKNLMPGGVNSPVRAYKPYPFFTEKAEGSMLYDVDGNSYIDYCLAYGPMILGHADSEINSAVMEQLEKGTMYGTPTATEVEIADLISKAYASIDMLRLVNSGTEATMHAIRLARGFTGRKKIIKFEGCYHGAHDYVLVKAGSGATTFGAPDSLGIPEETTRNTLLLPYNNVELIQQTIDDNPDGIAALIIEPVVGNAGVIMPQENYLKEVRKITEENDILLIADEVITGFRLAFGGAQEYFGFEADITTLGKIMGGGFILAAYGGRRKIMEQISPVGKVYQAATYSGNPVSVVAGLKALKMLSRNDGAVYKQLASAGDKIRSGLREIATDSGVSLQVNGVGSMFQAFFNENPVVDYKTAKMSDSDRFMVYQKNLLKRGVFVAPSQYETCFISTAHSNQDLDYTIKVMDESVKESLK
jgi:glutamate-1-semialdehyde 2,1-aminomutase